MDDIVSRYPEYHRGHPLPSGWRRLTDAEERGVWDRFNLAFDFFWRDDPKRGVGEPRPSVTYAVGHGFGETEQHDALQADLASRLVAAFRRCCAPGDAVYALDCYHQCYSFEPHQHPDALPPFAWPVKAFPDGDYHIFLSEDFRFGVLGHPWEETMCVFGEAFLQALAVERPQLFSQVVLVDGLPST